MGPHDPYLPEPPYDARFDGGWSEADLAGIDGESKTLGRIYRGREALAPGQLDRIVSLYDGALVQADERAGELLAELDRLGRRDDTLVVVTSDHGEELYDHNFYFLHSWSIYRSVLHVPLLVRLPGRVPAGQELHTVVESIDIAPTILTLLGLEPPASYQGSSLVPFFDGGGLDVAGEAYSDLGPRIHSLRAGRWHYILNPEGYTSPGARPGDDGHVGRFELAREELYDLEADPDQRVNLAAERPDLAAALRTRLQAWVDRGETSYEPGEMSEETLEELRALGYVK